MLVLAVHTVTSPSANVPFAVILLQDHVSNRKVPEGLKCRQLVPSSGAKSTSLWDVADAVELRAWLDEAINVDVTHEVFEVQEEFAIGLAEISRARAAEKVKEGTKEVVGKTGHALGVAATTVGAQVNEIDSKLRISESANKAAVALKESAVGRTTAAALGRVGNAVSTGTKKVMENEKVHATTSAVGNSFKKLGQSLSTLTSRKSQRNDGTEHTPQFVQDDSYPEPTVQPTTTTQPAPYQPPEPAAAGNMRNPSATAAPISSPPAQEQKLDAAPQFTLDDSESSKP